MMQPASDQAVASRLPLERLGHADPAEMLFIPGGTFRMGSDRHYPEEAPVHRVEVDGFWIDRHPVTNRQFRNSSIRTRHVTVAEITPDPKDYPGILPHMIYAGSLAFTPPRHAVDLRDFSQWWTFTRGANWRHPYGPRPSQGARRSSGRSRRLRDARRLCALGRQGIADRSRMGVRGARRTGRRRICVGRRADAGRPSRWPTSGRVSFRAQNPKVDGFERTSPVTAFPPNRYGVYDMIGNVWEWTTDWYSPGTRPTRRRPAAFRKIRAAVARTGSYDPGQPQSRIPRRSSKAARTCARRITAGATARPRATRRRSTHPPAMLAFDASGGKPA